MTRAILLAALVLAAGGTAPAAEDLLAGGGFEQGLAGWLPIWSRSGQGQAHLDREIKHGGSQAVRVEHTGPRDWCLSQAKTLPVQPGQVYVLSGWVRVRGEGHAGLSVVLRDGRGETLNWVYGERSVRGGRAGNDWRHTVARFAVPPGTATVQVRLAGNGPATVWLDDASLVRDGTLDGLPVAGLPESLELANKTVTVTLHPRDGTFTLTDRRDGTVWRQRAGAGGRLFVTRADKQDGRLVLELVDPGAVLPLRATLRLDGDRPEVVVQLEGEAGRDLADVIDFPAAFASRPGTMLILPVNEGIAYPADDKTLPPMSYHLYGGHGLCMPWYGLVDGPRGLLTIVETPDDAAVKLPRADGLLQLAPQWLPQKGKLGPARRLRLVLVPEGGYVALAKRYRQYAKDTDLFRTLEDKRRANPDVDRLVGAVNVWCWDRDPVAIVRELRAAGIERIQWSNRASPEALRTLNDMGVLTSRYDIYQDLMDPAVVPKLRGSHSDWTQDAWPHDIILDRDGKPIAGWGVKDRDGAWHACAVLCDRQAVAYAKQRIPAELKTHPYRCRFIDTTTAAPWNECWSPAHPMTRSESRAFKMDLLRCVSEGCGLVTGSETGHDAAVPVVHYFEGMLSLGPYRLDDAGRDMQRIVEDVPEQVAKFQTGPYYRLPLWELVYHDCVVAQWYWGDYNNKLPAVWDRRDLYNALYGTPPMFMFTRKSWQEKKDRFVQSYRTATAVARATGYSEMLAHRWLTDDHAVQETRFANGVTVTVNFGDKPYKTADGAVLPPLSHRVTPDSIRASALRP